MKKLFIILTALALVPVNLFSQPITNNRSPVTIKDAWIRPAAMNANSALFCEVVNNSSVPDTLVAAKGNFSELVEIHETFKKENDMMGMREVHNVAVPGKGALILKPGSFHIMLIGLNKDLRLGEKYEVVLVLKRAGEIRVRALVRDMPAMK